MLVEDPKYGRSYGLRIATPEEIVTPGCYHYSYDPITTRKLLPNFRHIAFSERASAQLKILMSKETGFGLIGSHDTDGYKVFEIIECPNFITYSNEDEIWGNVNFDEIKALYPTDIQLIGIGVKTDKIALADIFHKDFSLLFREAPVRLFGRIRLIVSPIQSFCFVCPNFDNLVRPSDSWFQMVYTQPFPLEYSYVYPLAEREYYLTTLKEIIENDLKIIERKKRIVSENIG